MNHGNPNATGLAIVGMAGRFPKARNLDEFWRNLCDGVEAVSFFSDDELAEAGGGSRGGPNFVKARAVLEDADLFDAAFFGMNPKEASLTDPQHRLFLECASEALENANCDASRFAGAIGVFAGMSTNTYLAHNLDVSPALTIGSNGEFQAMLGNEHDYLTSRVSYKLNLRGPSLNIQTACSTSLVAVSVACQHLLTYQCDLALAGAVSVSFPQKRGYSYQEGGIMSPDGHCRPFDVASAGTVAGEGVGVVALKRLEDALKDGDAIYAVIKGFATNNDGSHKIGYTAPSIEGQADVVALAQAMAGFAPETISYIEAHGTGTPLGDPIEIEGLTRAFRLGTAAKNFCALGSVKGNIGHLDTAAGIAGLIKTALALHHKRIPPSLHFVSPNPKIDFAGSPFHVVQAVTDWKNGNGPRRAGVSSFGIGGTNAHVVLEEAAPVSETPVDSHPMQLLLLSARTKTALQVAAKNLAHHLTKNPQANLADVAYTLQTSRRAFEQRATLVCRDVADAARALETFDAKRILTGAPPKASPSIVFMFPGQGAQHVNMGRQLYETEPVFRNTVDHCCTLLVPQMGLDLRTLLFPEAEQREAATQRLKETAITQPALFVVEYALAQLWMSWGVQPAAMIGHSLGEYVAACVAGVFSLEDALTLIATRGRMMQELPAGTMLAVRLPESEVKLHLNENLALATVNAATACVVSGPSDAIETFQRQLAERNVGCIALQTSHAFHSAMMEPILAPFAERVQSIKRQPPRIPFISNVTGTWITDAQAVDPAYWAAHLRQTVRLADGLAELFKVERVFLEVGPGQTLSSLARQHSARKATTLTIASLPLAKSEASDLEAMTGALGQLWISGVSPDWGKFYAGEKRRRLWLPTYPFERKRYWVEPAQVKLLQPAELSAGAVHGTHNSAGNERPAASVHAVADWGSGTSLAEDQGGSRLRMLVGKSSGLDSATLLTREHGHSLPDRGVADTQTVRTNNSLLNNNGGAPSSQHAAAMTHAPADGSRSKCVHQMFEEQAALTPSAVALVFQDERLTYAELNQRADEVAEQLRALGVGQDVPVGLCLERSPAMVIAVLAVLKAGGAYLPLDPTYPQERLKLMLENSRSPLVLTQTSLQGNLTFEIPNLKVLCIEALSATTSTPLNGSRTRTRTKDEQDDGDHAARSTHHASPPHSSDLAYIIHTSGSTGVPKGVAIEHRQAVNFIIWAQQAFTRDELAGVLFATSLCFDLSVFELFVTLSTGGKVILARNAIELPDLPAKNEVTLINTVPSAANELLRLQGIPPSVQVINLAGEPLKTALVDRLYALGTVLKVHDLYGPSETTTYSTYALRQAGALATVGRPIANTQIHLLDESWQPVVVGEIGEIFIGGAGVARGYLHRPDLTAERFVPDPFSTDTNDRLYRTGDLARWRDGDLEFLGRMDHQIKIRGYRVELGEIETALAQHPAVRECVVIAREDTPDEKRLVAYVVSGSGAAGGAAEFRRFLQAKLPDYMVPSAFVSLEAVPLTPNGKLDRKRLPAPEQSRPELAEDFVAPSTSTEQKIAAIWFEVLGWNQIGIHDDFFELGGDSLLAVQVVSRLRQAFEVEVPVAALFESPTIAQLAEGLVAARWGGGKAPESSLTRARRDGRIPLSFSQQRLWFIDQLTPGTFAYNMPVALRVEGTLDAGGLRECLDEIVRRHEILRTTFTVVAGEPGQTISPSAAFELPLVDLSAYPAAGRETEARRIMQLEAQRPFDLARGPLIRGALLRLDAHTHVLVIVMHHIISDGWSVDVLLKELGNLWEAGAGGGAAPLRELPVQYADYAIWQREVLTDLKLKPDLDYWKQTLAGAPPALKLPADRDGANETAATGARCAIVLSKETAEALAALNHQGGSTTFMTLLAALLVTLNRWTRQADLVVGTVSAGRTRRETEALLGCFMNFLPIRAALREGDTGLEILARVKDAVLSAHAHLDCPFEKVVEAVNPERGAARNPIYNVGFLLENFPKTVLATPQLTGTLLSLETSAALLDLRFIADDSGPGITLTCEYRADLFEARTIEELLASFREVLATLSQKPETNLAEFKLAAGLAEQAQKSRTPPDGITVTATFTAEPLAEPLEFWLRELELAAPVQFAPYNQIFQQLLDPASLLALNTSGLNVVLVKMEDWAAAPGHEGDAVVDFAPRIERTLGDLISALRSAAARSSTPLLLCICPSSKALARDPGQADFFSRMHQRIARELAAATNVRLIFPEQLAALYPVENIYDPRGDELGHVPYTPEFFTALATMIARTFHSQKRAAPKVIVLDCDQTLWAGVCGEDGADGIELSAPHRALQEFMRVQLEAGRLLCMCSKNNPEDVQAVFERHPEWPLKLKHFAATRINWLPKSENLEALAQELNLGLESFVLVDDNPVECAEVQANCPGALALQLPEDPEQFPEFLKHAWIFDHQTVTTEDSKRTDFYRQEHERVQARTDALSMSDFLAQLDLKVVIAELSPDAVPRAAQLTQRTNQFNCTTQRMTGAEIQGWPDQSKTLVVSVSDRFGDYGLVGLVVYGLEKDALAVETFLLSCRALGRGVEHQMLAQLGNLAKAQGAAHVDVHFVSSAKNKPALDFLETVGGPFRQALNGGYVFRFPAEVAAGICFAPPNVGGDALALVSSGKSAAPLGARPTFARWRWIALEASEVNQIQALIEAKAGVRTNSSSASVAPSTDVERELCRIWQELLRVEHIGIRDDFFELGGHSLLAVRMVAQVDERLHVSLPLITIFQSPTVEQFARAIDQQASQPRDAGLLPIKASGNRPPLFLVHGAGGDVLWGYANMAQHSDPDQPIYGIQADGAKEFATLDEMAAHYVSKVRAFQPSGPYCLGGYCFGGNVAQEMARQLEAQGEGVTLLALLDCAAANGSYEKFDWWRPAVVSAFTRNGFYWLDDFRHLKPEQRRSLVLRKLRTLPRKLWSRITGRQSRADFDLEEFIDVAHVSERETRLWNHHLGLLVRHVSKPYAGPIALFRTRSHPLICSFEDDLGWGKLATKVAIKRIPGSHEGIFMEPHVRHLAKELEQSLQAAHLKADGKTLAPKLV